MREPGDLLLTTSELLVGGESPDTLRRAIRRGELVRVRRGWYCLADSWRDMNERQRHLLRAAAVVADVEAPLLAGVTGAAVWDLPILGDWPTDVHLLAPRRTGGASEPGVRRTSVGARDAPVDRVLGLPVTSLSRTVVDLAASRGFVQGVMAVDAALRRGVRRDELHGVLTRRTSGYGARVARAAIDFGDPAAENGGESAARAAIAIAGFAVPELQVVVRDRLGEMRADFRWRRDDGSWLFGEFDGKHKYTRDEYSRGDPADVVWREKKREDRLRTGGHGTVRILWSHVMSRSSMVALLLEAGAPRGRNVEMAAAGGGAGRARLQPSGPR